MANYRPAAKPCALAVEESLILPLLTRNAILSTAKSYARELRAAIGDPAFSVVSFDVFDTLLRRRVIDPNQVFWLIEQVLLRRGYDMEWVRHYGHARIHAWHLAVRRANLTGRQDTTFREIYQVLGSVLPGARPHLQEIADLELEVEGELLEGYPFGVALFDHALSTGKTVVLCSDQYLPKDFIEGRLRAAGVVGYERFLLSSELGVLKITGALYDWLSVRLGVTRDQVLHIGDTEETDFRVAQQKGLAARLIPRSIDLGEHPSRHSAATRHPSVACMASAMFLHQQADLSHAGTADVCDRPGYLGFLGYALLGPIFVGLSRWLADRLSSGDLDRLWFLSRDGEGLAKAFKLLYPELAGRVSYVFASRRLLAYSTGELKAVEVFRHFCHIDRPGTTARAFLEKAFDGEAVDELVASFSEEETLGQPRVRERVIKAIDGFIDSGALASSDRADRIRGYYRSQLKGAKRLGVFDVGWRGNLQRSLIRALGGDGSDLNIKGYYLGHIFEEEIFKDSIECESFAFDLNFPGEVFQELSSCLWVTEFLFASTHLSVVDMELTSGQFRPVFEELTPAKDRLMAAGRVLQESALRFVSDGIAWNKHLMLEFAGREQLVHTLREFLMRPSRADAEAFVGEQAVIGIDENAGEAIVERVVMTGDAAELRRAYQASAWKAGFRAAIDDAVLSAALSTAPSNRWQRVVKMLRARLPA